MRLDIPEEKEGGQAEEVMGYVVKCDELEKAMCYVMKRDEQKKERRLKEKYLRCRRLLAHRTKIAKKGRNVKKRSGRKSTKKCLAKFEGKTSSPSIVSRKCSWCRPRAAHGARSPKKAKLRRKGFEGRHAKKDAREQNVWDSGRSRF